MNDIFLKLMDELNSRVFVLLAILAAAFYALYNLGKWEQIFKDHRGRIDKVEKFSDTLIEIKTKVDLIYQNNPNALYRSSSPISITDKGKEVAVNVDADLILSKHFYKLLVAVENLNPKNAYDIQEGSFEVCRHVLKNLLNESELTKIKNEAYSMGIPAEDIFSLFGILLRNKILDSKKIPIADLDKHTPKI